MEKSKTQGEFYIIGSPIGNLADLGKRAVTVLKKLDYCFCEDTRKTANLLKKHQIPAPKLVSLYQENEEQKIPQIVEHLKRGRLVGLISNAGLPLISDPGYRLTKRLIEEKINPTVVPGPSALTAALVVSGLPTDKFLFLGFLPKKSGKKRRLLTQALTSKGSLFSSVVFYESPFRIVSTIELIGKLENNLSVSVCRELTKKFEQVIRGNPNQVLLELKKGSLKGEITVVFSKK